MRDLPVLKPKISNIRDVAERHMCCGCGACAYVSPDEIEMVDDIAQGRRPRLRHETPRDLRSEEALSVCPGVGLEHPSYEGESGLVRELLDTWGPILELWEGYASDPEIRHAASSGGAASALALFCMERAGMYGTLHIRQRSDVPYLNETVLSTTRDEILAATGSRYAPASPCDGLQKIEEAPAPCVFIGKPCDAGAVWRARRLRPRLDERLGLTVAFFCAGTPSTRGTLEMLRRMGIEDPSRLKSLRYRGRGWPGKARAEIQRDDGGVDVRELTYEESWGDVLQKHRQWRCYVCADHTGEFADIAVGDPWYRPISEDEPGQSLILVRTERGRKILHEAMTAEYLACRRAESNILPASQPNLERTRGAVWGRVLGSRLLGATAPRFRGLPMFHVWWKSLSLKQKAQSVLGTFKRVFTKRLRKRIPVVAHEVGPNPTGEQPGSEDAPRNAETAGRK